MSVYFRRHTHTRNYFALQHRRHQLSQPDDISRFVVVGNATPRDQHRSFCSTLTGHSQSWNRRGVISYNLFSLLLHWKLPELGRCWCFRGLSVPARTLHFSVLFYQTVLKVLMSLRKYYVIAKFPLLLTQLFMEFMASLGLYKDPGAGGVEGKRNITPCCYK